MDKIIVKDKFSTVDKENKEYIITEFRRQLLAYCDEFGNPEYVDSGIKIIQTSNGAPVEQVNDTEYKILLKNGHIITRRK